MNNKGLLLAIPISLLSGTILVGASQMTTLLPMAVSPNSNQQVLVKMPVMGAFQPIGFWGGIAIAVGGTVMPILLSPKEEEPDYLKFQYQPPTLVIEPPTLATIGHQPEQEYQPSEPASPVPVVFPQRVPQPDLVEVLQNAKQQEFPVGKFTPEDRELVGLPDRYETPELPVFQQEPEQGIWDESDDDDQDTYRDEVEEVEPSVFQQEENLAEDIWGESDDDDQDTWNNCDDESCEDETGEDDDESYEEDEDEDESEPVVSIPSPVFTPPPQTPVIAYSHRTVQSTAPEIKFEEASICEAIAATNKPVIICSPPGTGKTSTIRAVICEVFKQDPSAELHIVDRKNGAGALSGRWMGLEKIPGIVVAPDKHLELLLDECEAVANIVDKRRHIPKSEIPKQHNVWLILDDYLAMYERSKSLARTLPKTSPLKIKLASYHADLCDIAYDGRELKVRVVMLTHSPNCEDLGLTGGQKKSFAFFVLGFLDKTQGQRADGGFGAISAALAQPSIFPNIADRDKLQKDFEKVSLASIEQGRPMFMTTMGIPRLGLMPDLSWTETYQLPLDFSQIDSQAKQEFQAELEQEDGKEPDAIDYLARFWDTHRAKD
jgi:DNA polymerase III delta prime subunit